MPDLKPFIVSGLALGGVYALSGVGLVVLYRTTAVLNFAYGAFGALGALVAWQAVEDGLLPGAGYVLGIAAAIGASAFYGAVINPRLATRDTAVRAAGSLGAALVVLGTCLLIWGDDSRSLDLPSTTVGFSVGTTHVNLTQMLALGIACTVVVAAGAFLRHSLSGTVMRALACDRELCALHGCRVRRTELVTWSAVGALAGISGILFANLVSLQAASLTFLVIASAAAGVIGRFRSLELTLLGGLAIGLVQACATPFASVTRYRDAAPFLIAIVTLLILDRIKAHEQRTA